MAFALSVTLLVTLFHPAWIFDWDGAATDSSTSAVQLARGFAEPSATGGRPEADGLRAPRRGNARIQVENDILKKAAVILGTKIHIVVDALGKLAAPMELTAGNVSDVTVVPRLLENLEETAVVGDSRSEAETGEANGYDSRSPRDKIRTQGCEPCIPTLQNAKGPEPYDAALYSANFSRIRVASPVPLYMKSGTCSHLCQ